MIYICCIIYLDYVIACVLTVGDDELAVGDDDDVLLEVAKGGPHAGAPQGTHVDRQVGGLESRLRSTNNSGERGNKNMT